MPAVRPDFDTAPPQFERTLSTPSYLPIGSKNMKTILFLASLLAMVFSNSVLFAADIKVTRENWTSEMKNVLPAALCREGSYFMSCFKVDLAACLKAANSATQSCLSQYESQIPATLIQPKDGREWGSKIGSCSGSVYDVIQVKQKINSDKCNDPAQWQ